MPSPEVNWTVVFSSLADADLWDFEADGWELRHGNPACGMLSIFPGDRGRQAELEDALWLADCLAYDHDAPVTVRPTIHAAADFPFQPIHNAPGNHPTMWYLDELAQAGAAAAEVRFGGSCCLRYHDEDGPALGTDFRARFAAREDRVSLYAMAARQADVLAEYLCLYRLLEAADGTNGNCFIEQELATLERRDFGTLRVWWWDHEHWTNAFSAYQYRARAEVRRLRASSCDAGAVANHLRDIRNSLAHGKRQTLAGNFGARFNDVAWALPVVKLLARIAIEP